LEAAKSGGGGGGGDANGTSEASTEPRDPMESLQSQQTLLMEHGPIAYLMDDPIRAALLIIVLLFLISWFLGALKRMLWTGKMVSVPLKKYTALEAAEAELKVLVGDVRGHLKRAAGTVGRVTESVGKVTVGAGGAGTKVVGGTGKVVRRTALPDL
jgi:hypothetical protein